jgi:hypothetical protein
MYDQLKYSLILHIVHRGYISFKVIIRIKNNNFLKDRQTIDLCNGGVFFEVGTEILSIYLNLMLERFNIKKLYTMILRIRKIILNNFFP